MRAFARFILKQRYVVVALTVCLTAFFGYKLTKLQINSDIISYLPDDDPAVMLFNKIGNEFGGNSLALVALETENVFSAETLTHIRDLTEKFKVINGITNVTSLTNIIDIKKTEEGLEVGKLIDPYQLPETKEQLAHLREYTLSKDLYAGRVVSTDARATLIICRISQDADRITAASEIKKTTLEAALPEKINFSGIPLQMVDLTELIFKDLNFLLPLVSILVFLTLLVSFGSLRGVLLPLLSVIISTIWTLGLMSLFGVALTVISNIIPVILVAIGTAYSIHVISRYDEDIRMGNHSQERLANALSEVGVAVLLAGVTTIFGFLSFIAGSYLKMIQQFGLFSAAGTLVSLLISMTFVPAVLSFLNPKKNKKSGFLENAAIITRLMDKICALVLRNEKIIIVGSLIILVISIFGIPSIERKVDMLDYFKPGTNIRVAQELMDKEFGGSVPIQISVRGDMQDPGVLKEMWRLQKFLDTLPDVHNPQSVTDLIAEMHDVIDDQKTIPNSRVKVGNLWFFIEGEPVMEQFVNAEYTEGVIQATLGTLETSRGRAVVDKIGAYIAGLDTTLYVIDQERLSALSAEDKIRIMDARASRTAAMITWEVQKRTSASVVDEAQLVASLLQGASTEMIATDDPDTVAFAGTAAKIIANFSPELQKDNKLTRAVRNIVADYHHPVTVVPSHVFEKLSNRPPAERITFSFTQTGMGIIYEHLDNSIISSQLQSLILAIVLVFFLLAIQFRSVIGGLIGVSPILLTLFVSFGIMGFTGIPLDVATVLVGSIAIGAGIDYSIHFSTRFKEEFLAQQRTNRDNGRIELEALRRTFENTGRAIVINALAVTFGFLTLLFAQIVPLQRFGMMVAITMIGSSAGALIFLPALMLITKAKFTGNFIKTDK